MNGGGEELIPGLDDIVVRPVAGPVVETEEIEEETAPISINNKKKGLNPFIEITNKEKVLPYVTSQKTRTNHFKFINEKDQDALVAALGGQYMIEFSEVKSKPHMAIMKKKNNSTNESIKDIVGKVHFLYYDKKPPQTKYIKLYLYDFANNEIQAEIEGKLKNFFENFTPSAPSQTVTSQGGKRRILPRKTIKKRRVSKRHVRRKTHARR